MLIFKCKMCGGDIQATEGQVHGTCDSCGTTSTLPKASDERIVNLFNRANQQRQRNDYDKAMANYENILNEDANNAEAHWGIILCRYGIEYVEDPRTHERIPTCHRVQYESILSDNDYLAALENAPDSYSRELYESEAKKISEIQKGILAISNTEEPYDVFICYKETTDGGSRTKDSALAQDIYYQLEKEGFKTFFARITLEGKLGQQYEPYIFAALNSAKVMLVIGTDPAYFNAVWVKNEWSRFLLLMKKDRSKLLIPCFKDMDAYDIPEELSLFQSQDMSKIGFMQDLIHGIKKVIAKPKAGEATVTTTTNTASSSDTGVDGLLRRAFLFLEDGDFSQASDYCNRVLDTAPENARAYIGLLCAGLQINKEENLANSATPLDRSASYLKALRFSDEKHRKWLEECNQYIIERNKENEEQERERQRQLAKERQREAEERAARERHETYVRAINEGQTAQTAAQLRRVVDSLRSVGDYEDAEAQAVFYNNLLVKVARKELLRNIKIGSTIAGVLAVIIFIVVAVTYIIPENKYNSAKAKIESNDLAEAREILIGLKDYKDSSVLVNTLDVMIAEQERIAAEEARIEAERLAEEAAERARIEEEQRKLEEAYQAAMDLVESGNLERANKAFLALGEYKDSEEQAEMAIQTHKQQIYDRAMEAIDDGLFQTAINLFNSIPGFLDSNKQAQNAKSLMEKEKEMELLAAKQARMDALKTAEVGGQVLFGKLDGDFAGEYRSWTVLEVRGDMMLLIADNTLNNLGFNTPVFDRSEYGNTWEYTDIRYYLNYEFIELIFCADEKEKIIQVENLNNDNPWFGTEGGDNTYDKVFLLSLEEVVRYYGDSGLLHNRPADIIADNGGRTPTNVIDDQFNSIRASASGPLRSPGYRGGPTSNSFAFIDDNGIISVYGLRPSSLRSVRPALWVSRN